MALDVSVASFFGVFKGPGPDLPLSQPWFFSTRVQLLSTWNLGGTQRLEATQLAGFFLGIRCPNSTSMCEGF